MNGLIIEDEMVDMGFDISLKLRDIRTGDITKEVNKHNIVTRFGKKFLSQLGFGWGLDASELAEQNTFYNADASTGTITPANDYGVIVYSKDDSNNTIYRDISLPELQADRIESVGRLNFADNTLIGDIEFINYNGDGIYFIDTEYTKHTDLNPYSMRVLKNSTFFKYFAFGTGTTPPTASDLQLENELMLSDGTNDYNVRVDTTAEMIGQKLVMVSILPAYLKYSSADNTYIAINGEITEMGIFNLREGGIMYNRVVFEKIPKDNYNELLVEARLYT